MKDTVLAAGVPFVFCQSEDGIRDLGRSRGLGDVYKRQRILPLVRHRDDLGVVQVIPFPVTACLPGRGRWWLCLLYTSDAADERSSVDLGGRRIIKKKKRLVCPPRSYSYQEHVCETKATQSHEQTS